MEVEAPSSPQPYESEEPQMSQDQLKAMSVLEKEGSPQSQSSGSQEDHDHNPEMSAFAVHNSNNNTMESENDIEQRIQKANQDLAKQPQPQQEREKRIKFKENLIDFEAPPDNPPMSPDSTTTQDGVAPNATSDETKEQEAGCVLVEKEGKFELFGENEDTSKSKTASESSIEDILGLNDSKKSNSGETEHTNSRSNEFQREDKSERKSRPMSAPNSKAALRNGLPPVSYQNPPPRPKSAGHDKLSRGHRSAEMIEEAKELQRQRQREESEKRRKEQDEKEQKEKENREAFEAWCREKEAEAKEQRKKQREAVKKLQEQEEDKDIAENEKDKDAFEEWKRMKSEQEKKERMFMKFQKEEEAQWVATRSQKDCDKAYRRWLKQKRRQELEEKSFLLTSRASSAVLTRKSRKSAQMAQAIKLAQQFKFIDHYGYR
ncbi:coiled-coil domain-containing protein 181-like isoform X2 [Symsagittifera roscoffensis]|uniref:coiled-coil domain-containing protein 181-like isoform X2 n=1 Tax=Symsagittifera roscoffensis TaxID=84072 RepID=UPI00307CB436